MTAIAQWPYAERLAVTAEARTAAMAMFEKRLGAYRVLTREQGLPRKIACRNLGISETTACLYEERLTGMTGAERRAARLQEFAGLRASGLTRRQAADQMDLSYATADRYENELRAAQEVSA